MAGDWIKMRTALATDPAVIDIAAALKIDEFSVVGRLHHLWGWADAQSLDGNAPGVTENWIDRYVQAPGFAAAMSRVSWLIVNSDGVSFPNFDVHNGETAKARALGAKRVQTFRGKTVTDPPLQVKRPQRYKSVTREEKRDKENIQKKVSTTIPEGFAVSDRVRSWAEDKGHDRLEARLEHFVGWARAKGAKYVDWDEAFMNAIRDNWAKLGPEAQPRKLQLAL